MKRIAALMLLLTGVLLTCWPSVASAAFPGKNGRIAFTVYHNFKQQCPPGSSNSQNWASDQAIFTMNPNGSDARQVTATQHAPPWCDPPSASPSYAFDEFPSYSPSGNRLAFTLTYGSVSAGVESRSIDAINADGTN